MPISYPHPTVALARVYARVSDYAMLSYPVKDLPLRVRPALVFATAAWVLLLGVLGMAPLPELPVNDKALHFFGMGFATFVVYFVLEVPDKGVITTVFTTFFLGGIVSEFVQAALPWKEFQSSDIAANLLGSTLFLYLAHLLHTRNRRRQEISSLYQPLASDTYRDAQGRRHHFSATGLDPEELDPADMAVYAHGSSKRKGSNVWDEEDSDLEGGLGRPSGEDGYYRGPGAGAGAGQMFGIGDDEDDARDRR